jgi:hypothetical protein
MSFSETIRAKWNPRFERYTVGNLAFDAMSRALESLDAMETKGAQIIKNANLSDSGKRAEKAKVAAANAGIVEQARRVLAMCKDNLRDQRLALIPKPANVNDVRGMMLRQETRSILRQKPFGELLNLFGADGTAREVYEAFFEAPSTIMGVTEAQRDQLVATTVERLGGRALVAIAEQSEAIELLEATCRYTTDTLCRAAAIQPVAYSEWVQKVAPVDDTLIAAEKVAFESEVNRPAEEPTPLIVRSMIVRHLLETGEAA